MATARGYSNHNEAGSSRDRRRRRQWLLDTFGDGVHAACYLQVSPRCLWVVDIETLSVDRIIPRDQGGRYTRDNIQPACPSCNSVHGNQLRWAKQKATPGKGKSC